MESPFSPGNDRSFIDGNFQKFIYIDGIKLMLVINKQRTKRPIEKVLNTSVMRDISNCKFIDRL